MTDIVKVEAGVPPEWLALTVVVLVMAPTIMIAQDNGAPSLYVGMGIVATIWMVGTLGWKAVSRLEPNNGV